MKKFFKRLLVVILVLGLACGAVYIVYPEAYSFILSGGASAIGGDLEAIDAEGSEIDDEDLDSLDDSGISGSDLSFDTDYYPYYGFLSSTQKTIYAQVCANVEAFTTTFVPVTGCTVDDACAAIEAVFYDHPEYFWLETGYSYKYTDSENCVQIIMWFNDLSDDPDSAKALFDASANAIIDTAATYDTDYDREKYVHDAIISLASYDENGSYNQSAYSALVTGSTVCAGYSRAFQYIMTSLGIPTYYCTGYSGGDHAWNIVMLDDGYYNVDLTWDDSDPVSYMFFNCTDDDFASTHTRTDASTLLPACTATTYRGLEGTGGPGVYPGPSDSSDTSSLPDSDTSDTSSLPDSDTSDSSSIPDSDTSDSSSVPDSDSSDTSSLPDSEDETRIPTSPDDDDAETVPSAPDADIPDTDSSGAGGGSSAPSVPNTEDSSPSIPGSGGSSLPSTPAQQR